MNGGFDFGYEYDRVRVGSHTSETGIVSYSGRTCESFMAVDDDSVHSVSLFHATVTSPISQTPVNLFRQRRNLRKKGHPGASYY
jgi:hypothetical protein